MSSPAASNKLAHETSPYLLQHKDNPVAWWPWGPEALAAAQREQKPVLLSVGYAACHWCHVMAHESFENPAIAAVMNELFINIKVDREERPDIDQIYMAALHHLGEQGGWPLTMFLTPGGEPFWGGTYFPSTPRYGRPGFVDLMREVSRLFREEPGKIDQNRAALMDRLQERARQDGKIVIGREQLDKLAEQIGTAIDPLHGGLRGAPKFPQAALYELLWRAGLREDARHSIKVPTMHGGGAAPNPPPAERRVGSANAVGASRGGGTVATSTAPPTPDQGSPSRMRDGVPTSPPRESVGGGEELAARPSSNGRNGHTTNRYFRAVDLTLDRICQGGIYDHLGGGFSRYSVDERWLVPHFEKMLYDNAQLLELLALAHAHTSTPLYRQRARETVAWLAREMTTPEGAFASSLDADSEGEEGKFYVWSLAEIERVLRSDADTFAAAYDVTAAGNFEGHTILNRLTILQRNIGIAEQAAETASGDDDPTLAMLRGKLLAERENRVRPGLDDKVLADWNGLMIAALARTSALLDQPAWLAMARRAFGFISQTMARGDRLGHSWRAGRLLFPGLASDLAAMIRAALALHEVTGEATYLTQAVAWQRALDRHYANPDNGGYFFTADDAEGLVIRPAATSDDAVPNANAVAAENLLRLALVTGDHTWREAADRLFDGVLPLAAPNLLAHAALLNALDLRLHGAEIVVTGRDADADTLVRAALNIPYLIRTVLRAESADALPAAHPARDKIAASAGTAAFVCVGETCSLPVTTAQAMHDTLQRMRGGQR